MIKQTFMLPWPPSTNAIWRAVSMGGKPRNILSKAYREWKEEALKVLRRQDPVPYREPVKVSITLFPANRRVFDLDNRVKALLDVLVKGEVLMGDDIRHITEITVSAFPVIGELAYAVVQVVSTEAPAAGA